MVPRRVEGGWMLGRALALAGVLVLAAGTAADAATLTGKVRPGTEETDGTPFGPVRYRAAPGEVNRLTVREGRGRIVYRDPGAVIRTRGNCRSVSLHVARCPYSESSARVNLGNQADTARLRVDFAPNVIGGPGPDRIFGGTGFDTLKGKGGRDTIRGGGGGDEIYGGGGSDRMLGAGGDDILYDDRPDGPTSGDLFDGGAGKGDTVDYSKRTKALDLDFARSPVNSSREGDRIVRVENANGGDGPDRIAGTARRDILSGNGGDDRILGRGGPDYVEGRAGDDTVVGGGGGDILLGDEGKDALEGGDGNDTIHSTDRFAGGRNPDREPDAVRCGGGSDNVDGGPRDTITGCEIASPWEGVLWMKVEPEVAGDQATFTTECHPEAGDACAGTISLKSPEGVVYGSGSFSLPENSKKATFSITLTAEGQAALAAGGVVVVSMRPDDDTVYDVRTAGYRTFMQA
jgi:Ca2+-binding RTX toxin-like protein